MRSAGFPARWATTLHSEETLTAITHWRKAIELRNGFIETLKADLKERVLSGARSERNSIQRLRKKLRTVSFIASRMSEFDDGLRSRLEHLLALHASVEKTGDDLRETYGRAMTRLYLQLQETMQRDRLREAIAWQSRSALRAVDRFLSSPSQEMDSAGRSRMYCALSYLQRLCLKNDSIGFFGPVVWGVFSEDVEDIDLEIRAPIVARHEYYLETWALNNVSRLMAQDSACKAWMPLRRMPSIAVHDNEVRLPMQPPMERERATVSILRMCDGSVNAHDVAAELMR